MWVKCSNTKVARQDLDDRLGPAVLACVTPASGTAERGATAVRMVRTVLG
jgi:hypothetical protein